MVWDLPTRQPVRTLQMPAKGPISAVLVMDRPMFLPGESVADAILEPPPESYWTCRYPQMSGSSLHEASNCGPHCV